MTSDIEPVFATQFLFVLAIVLYRDLVKIGTPSLESPRLSSQIIVMIIVLTGICGPCK
jgi:hypothetical protein